jgi:hypothetical protein
MGEPVVQLRKRRDCPICAQPSQQKFHPFCTRRCAEVDLNRWLSGAYAIAAEGVGGTALDTAGPDDDGSELR